MCIGYWRVRSSWLRNAIGVVRILTIIVVAIIIITIAIIVDH